ncbi:DUF6099 family protein [Streptacidiphilus rugosus]|uniref:DUF6099 family protein n=1 Tax=Streptacidiphilus rugosus TaxID=405783 RepID=UPI000A5652B2|nr:DUF6099 family protein [Streptacidiphilus rugosus]
MDALRLIKANRHALAEARTAADVVVEAWQACRMVESVAQTAALALTERALEGGGCGPVEIARALAEAGAHAAECIGRPPDEPVTGERAARLSELADVGAALRELRLLIQEASESLLVVACGADEQELYWSCVDGVDAAFQARELLTELLRAIDEETGPGPDEGLEPAREGAGFRQAERAALGPAGRASGRAGVRLDPPPG